MKNINIWYECKNNFSGAGKEKIEGEKVGPQKQLAGVGAVGGGAGAGDAGGDDDLDAMLRSLNQK